MKRPRLPRILLPLLLLFATPSCATIAGTLVSPITGGVDLVVQTQDESSWYLWLPVFVGGAVSGPFVAFYNGVNYDPKVFRTYHGYWMGFDQVFRPFEMVGVSRN